MEHCIYQYVLCVAHIIGMKFVLTRESTCMCDPLVLLDICTSLADNIMSFHNIPFICSIRESSVDLSMLEKLYSLCRFV